MRDFFRTILLMTAGIVVPLGLQMFLSRRMSAARREGGWSRVTWAAALYAIGPLSMLPFCWVTRRWRGYQEGARALALGVVWTLIAGGLIGILDQAYATITGLPPDDAPDPASHRAPPDVEHGAHVYRKASPPGRNGKSSRGIDERHCPSPHPSMRKIEHEHDG